MNLLGHPLARQPVAPPRINWANPITQGLVFCGVSLGDAYVDLITGQQADVGAGTISKVSYSSGAASKTAGPFRALKPNASSYLQFARQTGLDLLTTQGTIFAVGFHSASVQGNAQYVLASFESATNFAGAGLAIDDYNQVSANGVMVFVRSSAVGPTWVATTAVLDSPEQNLAHIIGGAWDGTNGYCYHSGTTRTSAALALTANLTTGRVTYVNRGNNDANGEAGNVLALVWNRVLAESEYRVFAMNPWAVLSAPSRLIFSVPGAPVSISVAHLD